MQELWTLGGLVRLLAIVCCVDVDGEYGSRARTRSSVTSGTAATSGGNSGGGGGRMSPKLSESVEEPESMLPECMPEEAEAMVGNGACAKQARRAAQMNSAPS